MKLGMKITIIVEDSMKVDDLVSKVYDFSESIDAKDVNMKLFTSLEKEDWKEVEQKYEDENYVKDILE
jgi:hypothetical protein